MSNRYHRKPGNRKLREQLIIITEGSLTEVQYIEEICAHFKVPSSLVKIETPSYTNAEGLVKYAVRRLVDQKKQSSIMVLAQAKCGFCVILK